MLKEKRHKKRAEKAMVKTILVIRKLVKGLSAFIIYLFIYLSIYFLCETRNIAEYDSFLTAQGIKGKKTRTFQ